jgi:hypothetical protein
MWDDVANAVRQAKGEKTMKAKVFTTSFTVDKLPKKSLTPSTSFVGGGQNKLPVVPTNSVLSLSSTTKTFIKAKDAYDRAIGSAEDPAVKEFIGQKTRLIFSLGSVEITPRYPSPI